MSTFHTVEVTCAACQEPFEARLLDSLNAYRHPAGRQELLDRTLHRHTCPHCGVHNVFDKPMLYTDLGQGLFVQSLPEVERLRFAALEHEIVQVHQGVFSSPNSPPFVREIGQAAPPRLVFGYEELREKIVAAEHDLDDRLIEILKLQLIMGWPDLLAAGLRVILLDGVSLLDGVISLDGVLPERGIEFVLLYADDDRADGLPVPTPDGAPRRLAAPMHLYDALAEQRPALRATYGQLFTGAWVNALRYKFNPDDLHP